MNKLLHTLSKILPALLLCGTACAKAPESSSQQSPVVSLAKPNIIFIITDDQNLQEFNYINPGSALSPHVDRLANEGIRFNRAYVASSVCSPSRFTCLSGQYASRCSIPYFTDEASEEGVTKVLWNIGFAPGQPILPTVLQDNGYTTGFVGKWHINGLPGWQPIPKGTPVTDPMVNEVLASNQAGFIRGIKGFGFDFADRVLAGNPDDDKALRNTGLNVHNQEWLTQAGLNFIEENKDKPFFLYFSTTLTHSPDGYTSLTGDPRRSPGGYLDTPITGVQPSRESVVERCKAAGIPKERWAATWLDDGVGALTQKLEELGLAENTLIVYFVDHGMAAASKGTCYEGGLITPTAAYWPGTVQPHVSNEMIQNIDFVPTFLEVAGIEVPANMELDGRSFAPLLRGEAFAGYESVYSEIGLTRAVSTEDWKYIAFKVPPTLQRTLEERMAEQMKTLEVINQNDWIVWPVDPEARYYQMGMAAGGNAFERWQLKAGGAWKENYFDSDQLYDLENDPMESTNLANDPKYAAKLAEMKALLTGYLMDLPGTYPELKPNAN